MRLSWTPEAWQEYQYWQNNNKQLTKRINQLIKDIQRTPLLGLGKPEPLKFEYAGKWSRRIDKKHRLLYQVNDTKTELTIFQCRFHY